MLVGLGMCTDSAYGLLAGSLGAILRDNRTFVNAQRWVAGSVFLGLGVSAAVTGLPEQ
jgi:threonine/homoserine/homoserine lactone efflux protein